jgi:hypothetical protein
MKVILVHNEKGEIISLTVPQLRKGTGVGVQLGAGEALLEVDIPDALATDRLPDLIKGYRVAVAEKKLIHK